MTHCFILVWSILLNLSGCINTVFTISTPCSLLRILKPSSSFESCMTSSWLNIFSSHYILNLLHIHPATYLLPPFENKCWSDPYTSDLISLIYASKAGFLITEVTLHNNSIGTFITIYPSTSFHTFTQAQCCIFDWAAPLWIDFVDRVTASFRF